MTQTIVTPLWYVNATVDTVQDAKNKFLDTFVFDDKVRAPLKQFVEAQREFTKQVNRTFSEVVDYTVVSTKSAIEKTAESLKAKK